METAISNTNDTLNFSFSDKKELTPCEVLYFERKELYAEYEISKSPAVLELIKSKTHEFDALVAKLPKVDPQLEMKAIMAFNKDKRFSITE